MKNTAISLSKSFKKKILKVMNNLKSLQLRLNQIKLKNGIEYFFLWCEKENTLFTVSAPKKEGFKKELQQNLMGLNTKKGEN